MKNRWVVLVAGVLIQTILGGIYAWSVFVPSLRDGYGIEKGLSGTLFGVCIGVFTVAMIFAGRILSRKGPRITAAIGAVLFAAGYAIASASNGHPAFLLLGIGVFSGAGIGFGYVCPLTVGMQWFPRQKGLISGLAVAGFGGGAIVLSSVASRLLAGGMDVLQVFMWIAIVAGGLLLVAALLLASPDSVSRQPAPGGDGTRVRSLPFLLAAYGLFSGTFAGLLVIGNLTPMAIVKGLSMAAAAQSVSAFAIGNAAGRILWGHWFDRVSYASIPLSLAGLGAALILFGVVSSPALFIFSAGLLGFGFGANFVVYASTLSAYFGLKAFPRLYPIAFLGYGVAGITGPAIGGMLAERTGEYGAALGLSLAVVLLATLVTAWGTRVYRRPAAADVE